MIRHQPLIPGLPDDVAVDCLIRLPYISHSALRSVCRKWRDLLSSSIFYRLRRATRATESFVLLVHAAGADETQKPPSSKLIEPPSYGLTLYNATLDTWHRLSRAGELPLFSQCVALPSIGKVVVLGGWDPLTLNPVPDVLVLDAATGLRRRARPMQDARSFFACAAVGSLVYVAGGHDGQKNALRSAEVYDPLTDTWRALPPMAEERDECQGMEWRGRFWVVSGYGTENQGHFDGSAEWFDEVGMKWVKAENLWEGDTRRMCLVLGERLCILECGVGGRGVREYDEVERRWGTAGDVPEGLRSSCCVVGIGDAGKVFVMGSEGGEQRQRGWVMDVAARRWTKVETPASFSGFVFSGASICM